MQFYVSDSTEGFAELETLFLGRYGGGPVEQIAIEQYGWPPVAAATDRQGNTNG